MQEILGVLMIDIPCFMMTAGSVVVAVWAIVSTIHEYDPSHQ